MVYVFVCLFLFCLLLTSSSFGTKARLYFVIVVFSEYLHFILGYHVTVVAGYPGRYSIGTVIRGSRFRAPVSLYMFLTLWHLVASVGYPGPSYSKLTMPLVKVSLKL